MLGGRAGLICERIAARIDEMRGEIAIIRDRMESYGQIRQLRDAAPAAPAPPPRVEASSEHGQAPATASPAVQVEATDTLFAADGFQDLEFGRSGPFRWTGPRHDARFTVKVDRTARLRAVVTLHAIGDAANEQALELLVEGTAYPLLREAGTNRFHAGPIRARAGDAATKLALRVPYLTLPSASGGFDTRTLGVAFQRLVLSPI